ncbi:hypothetical protein B0H15DRAFT_114849 [Mycena belliarum]|uniref:NAD-dependent epimerase/dehydratase domain-containing protein n=1 Tax=Mycena belliarum TaxID=1033014 RepID=A0AAD6TLZ5_9AGAR|nr:hypothetical protein B0H15DRAFT_114849 [Mycena belliae]
MSELIFVTGASGFIGSHLVEQLLEKGYRVRAAARGAKADHMKSSYASFGDRIEIVKIVDIGTDKFPEALVGVDAIIHTACPLAGREEPAKVLATAVDGTMNVLVQGEQAGVRRFVVTSSIGAILNDKFSFTHEDWNPITREETLKANHVVAYSGAKKFAEVALWEWAEKHPHVDVTSLTPSMCFGPFAAHYAVPPAPDFAVLASNSFYYALLFPDGFYPFWLLHIDVRDVARAHVCALSSPPTAEVGRKRVVLSSPYGWQAEQLVAYIAEQRPELKSRLLTAPLPPPLPLVVLPMDFGRVEKILGMKVTDFHTMEATTLDTIDNLAKIQDQWRAAGHTLAPPPEFEL